MSETDDTVAELKALVALLSTRLQMLETSYQKLETSHQTLETSHQTLEEKAALWHPEVSDEVLLAISAACAAYLGERAIIKQVHLRRGSAWASQGRTVAQQSHADLHGMR